MDTSFQPVIAANARGHYRQHPLDFKRALVPVVEHESALAQLLQRLGCP